MVKAEVKYTLEHFKALNKNNKSLKQALFVIYILMMFNIIAAALQIIFGSFSFATIINIIIAALLIWYIVFVEAFAHKKALKKYTQRFPDAVIYLTFSEDSVLVETSGSGYSENSELAYDKFVKINETDRFFFLYPNAHAAYIVGKHEITEGSVEELRSLLGNNLNGKSKKSKTKNK